MIGVKNTFPGIELTFWNKEDLTWDEALKEYPSGFSVSVAVYSLSPDPDGLTENEKKGIVKLAENMRNYKYKSSDLYFNRLKPSTVTNSATVQEIIEKGAGSERITSTCVIVDLLDVSRTEDIVCN